MDVTSGAAVAALLFDLFDSEKTEISPETSNENEKTQHCGSCAPMRILDLCCAPGYVFFISFACHVANWTCSYIHVAIFDSIKLCMLADLSPPSSVLVGVDISSHRISLCKNIIKKYHIDATTSSSKPTSTRTINAIEVDSDKKVITPPRVTIRLYCADGTTFGTNRSTNSNGEATVQHHLVFDCNAAVEDFRSSGGKRKRMNKSARAREKRRLLELQRSVATVDTTYEIVDDHPTNLNATTTDTPDSRAEKLPAEKNASIIRSNEQECVDEVDIGSDLAHGFDRVIVDAECSTDGAMMHNEKRQCALPSKTNPIWNDTNMHELVELQKRLIDSGFRLLKRGGVMVYSTCSLSPMQNEQVVQWLLEKCQDAFIIPASFSGPNKSSQDLSFIEEGSIRGTVRFNPTLNDDVNSQQIQGSGFFLAKIGKTI